MISAAERRAGWHFPGKIGRASCRERGEISGGAVSLKKKRSSELDEGRVSRLVLSLSGFTLAPETLRLGGGPGRARQTAVPGGRLAGVGRRLDRVVPHRQLAGDDLGRGAEGGVALSR